MHGQSGEISGTFINQGTISVDLAGRPAGSTADEDLTLIGTGWINQGTLQVDNGATLKTAGTWSNAATGTLQVENGGTLTTGGTWSNAGTMNVQIGGTLNLGGSIKTSTLGTIDGAAGTVNITGTLTNDATLALTDTTGSWVLAAYGDDRWRHDHDLRQRGADRPESEQRLERRHLGRHARAHVREPSPVGPTVTGGLTLQQGHIKIPEAVAGLRGLTDPGRHRRGRVYHA